MIERLPKDCTTIIDALPKAFRQDIEIGFSISTTSGGKNKFKLCLSRQCKDKPMLVWLLFVEYDPIGVSGISKLFDASFPDFLLKSRRFISIDDFASKYKICKNDLAVCALRSLKSKMTSHWKWTHGEGVQIVGRADYYNADAENSIHTPAFHTPTFHSFNEFLVWTELNVK